VTTKPETDNAQPALADEGEEEFDIEDMLLKMEAQCQKLEREWMAARYVLPVGVLWQFEGWYSWPSIRDLYKEFVKDVGLE